MIVQQNEPAEVVPEDGDAEDGDDQPESVHQAQFVEEMKRKATFMMCLVNSLRIRAG